MNNAIGSFDNFSFREESDSADADNESSGSEELNDNTPSQAAPDIKGPKVKKTILCKDEFIPMTKIPSSIENPQEPLPNSSSDAPETTKEKTKKKSVKESNSTPSNSNSKVKTRIAPKAQPKTKKGGRSPPQEASLESSRKTSPKLVNTKQTKVVKRSLSKRQKRRELSEDIKAQLKAVFNNLSKIYFSID